MLFPTTSSLDCGRRPPEHSLLARSSLISTRTLVSLISSSVARCAPKFTGELLLGFSTFYSSGVLIPLMIHGGHKTFRRPHLLPQLHRHLRRALPASPIILIIKVLLKHPRAILYYVSVQFRLEFNIAPPTASFLSPTTTPSCSISPSIRYFREPFYLHVPFNISYLSIQTEF